MGYEQLVRKDRVHGSLYTDPQIYADEIERIWRRDWVAIGHESEVPAAGDFVQKKLAGESLIMVRGKDDKVRLFLNRCPHRGNRVCEKEHGNARAFTCPYHAWTFNNQGELQGYPNKTGYSQELDKAEFGLAQVPRVDTYQGFVFASLAAEGKSLVEHLGRAASELDRLASYSPEGRIEINSGWLSQVTRANWKVVIENEVDGYHVRATHSSILSSATSPLSQLYVEHSGSVVRDLGNGHTEMCHRETYRKGDKQLFWLGAKPDALPNYREQLAKVRGDKAPELLVDGPPHLVVWPNLFIGEIFVLFVEPTGVDSCIQHQAPITFVGAPDLNEMILRQFVGLAGPAGFFISDDAEIYERNQRGLAVSEPQWLYLGRGLDREKMEEQGSVSSDITDETTQRAIWTHYLELMATAEAN